MKKGLQYFAFITIPGAGPVGRIDEDVSPQGSATSCNARHTETK